MTKTHDQGEYSPGPWNNARLELGEHAIPIQSRLESLTSGNRVRTSHEGFTDSWREQPLSPGINFECKGAPSDCAATCPYNALSADWRAGLRADGRQHAPRGESGAPPTIVRVARNPTSGTARPFKSTSRRQISQVDCRRQGIGLS